MYLTAPNAFQHDRIRSTDSGNADPLICGRLREVENIRTEAEHRVAAFCEVKPARVDLAEMGENVCLDVPVLGYELTQRTNQFRVRKSLEHGHHLSTGPSR